MTVVENLLELVRLVVAAIASGKPERVAEIVPPALQTTLAKAAADARARAKFEPEQGA